MTFSVQENMKLMHKINNTKIVIYDFSNYTNVFLPDLFVAEPNATISSHMSNGNDIKNENNLL